MHSAINLGYQVFRVLLYPTFGAMKKRLLFFIPLVFLLLIGTKNADYKPIESTTIFENSPDTFKSDLQNPLGLIELNQDYNTNNYVRIKVLTDCIQLSSYSLYVRLFHEVTPLKSYEIIKQDLFLYNRSIII